MARMYMLPVPHTMGTSHSVQCSATSWWCGCFSALLQPIQVNLDVGSHIGPYQCCTVYKHINLHDFPIPFVFSALIWEFICSFYPFYNKHLSICSFLSPKNIFRSKNNSKKFTKGTCGIQNEFSGKKLQLQEFTVHSPKRNLNDFPKCCYSRKVQEYYSNKFPWRVCN